MHPFPATGRIPAHACGLMPCLSSPHRRFAPAGGGAGTPPPPWFSRYFPPPVFPPRHAGKRVMPCAVSGFETVVFAADCFNQLFNGPIVPADSLFNLRQLSGPLILHIPLCNYILVRCGELVNRIFKKYCKAGFCVL